MMKDNSVRREMQIKEGNKEFLKAMKSERLYQKADKKFLKEELATELATRKRALEAIRSMRSPEPGGHITLIKSHQQEYLA